MAAVLCLFQELRFQNKRALVGLAIHVVVAVVIDQTNAFDLAALLDHGGRSLDLQILDQQHRIAIGQRGAIGIFDHTGAIIFITSASLV